MAFGHESLKYGFPSSGQYFLGSPLKKKFYDYENFSNYKELWCDFKNAKK